MKNVLIIHERINTWCRQLRPRVAAWPVRIVETRSTDDLVRALRESLTPIAVFNLGQRSRAGLEDLARARFESPDMLALVIEPGGRLDLGDLARELGATAFFGGFVPPPEVIALLERWVALASRRAATMGWIETPRDTREKDMLIDLN